MEDLSKVYVVDKIANVIRLSFKNPLELWDKCWVASDDPGRERKNSELTRRLLSIPRSRHWDGMNGSCEELFNTVRDGWDDGITKGQALGTKLEGLRLPSARRKMRHGPVGSNLDMTRVYAGQLDSAWSQMARSEDCKSSMKKVSTTILVRVGENCDTSAEALFWRGAVASVLTHALEESGRPVRVVAYAVVTNLGPSSQETEGDCPARLAFDVTVKDFRDPLELNKLFSVTGLSGFWRMFIFKGLYCVPYFQANGCLGRSVTRREGDLQLDTEDGSDVVVDVSQVSCEADAIAEIEKFRANVENPQNWRD